MHFFINAAIFELFGLILVLFSVVSSVCGKEFREGYYPGLSENFYEQNQRDLEIKVKTAINKLQNAPAPQLVPDWPNPAVKMGQVSGVALNPAGHVLVFHRGPNVWDIDTFTDRNIYRKIGDSAITQPTILVFNDTGDLVDHWGENLFYMPHGITVDKDNNVWVTDVALHQVFKFAPQQREKPVLVLGEKFVPRDDDRHFCKPSAVAVLSTGDFFVADGYCNSRIIKFAADGTRILQWGSRNGDSNFVFRVPHALSLAEQRGLVLVADRERGRVAAFRADNGTFVSSFRSWLLGPRIFSVAYAPVLGGRLYVVNGPTRNGDIPVRGYVIDFNSGRLIQTFAPENDFSNPHDIVTSADGSAVYVVELNPYKVYKFVDEEIKNETVKAKIKNMTSPAKPTATVEVSSTSLAAAGAGAGPGWRGAAGAAAAAGAALLALAALALLKARNNGRKSVTRRRWEYGRGEFKLRRLLERRRFTRVHSEDSDEEPAPMLPPQPPATA